MAAPTTKSIGTRSRKVISLNAITTEATYVNSGTTNSEATFCSASARTFAGLATPPVLQISIIPDGGIEIVLEVITLWAPHSWWGQAGQSLLLDPLQPADTVKFKLLSGLTSVDIRLDLTS